MISPEQYIDGLEWRYACKKFDPEARIEKPTWHALAESLRLSPSSLGLQLWKFVVVTNKELKARLREVSWNQSQVEDCSHYVVLCAAGRPPSGTWTATWPRLSSRATRPRKSWLPPLISILAM